MRSTGATLCVVAVLVAACGGEASAPQVTESPPESQSTTSPTTAAPVSPSSTSTTVDEPSPTVSPTLPPTTVEEPAATTTTATTTPPTPLSGPVTLRGDGLGGARFGRPMVEVEQWLVGEFGAPVWETVARAPLAASQWYEARDLFRSLTFEIGELSPETGHVTSLGVLFSDVSHARDDGVAHLVGWNTHPGTEPLALPAGLAIGMSLAELEAAYPNVVLTPADPQGVQQWFEIVEGDAAAVGLRGLLSWDGLVFNFEAGIRGREYDETPPAPATPGGPLVADLELRPDGLDGVDFRGPAGDLVATLEARFGLPAEETIARARPGEPLYGPLGFFPESELHLLTWYDPGLTILIADGQNYGATEPGDLRLVFWSTTSTRLRLQTGVGVGSSLAELTSAYATVMVGSFEECAGAYYPAALDVDTGTGSVAGTIDWDWVSDVQQALNDRGASLAVDGEYGPRTRAAVEEFQAKAAIEDTAPWDSDGWIGPQTLDALGIAAPPDAPVGSLRAGYPGSC
ncbi:MAG: peptidoglycan-binding protein [Acidimicrobiia bacterium]|nr:peptidoglycan-binding protein [Acidimicrobiia bacterium]